MAQEAPRSARNVLVIANPIAGRGRGERAAGELERALVRRGAGVELFLTRGRGDATRCAAQHPGAELVIAVGGDGTLSEVLQGLPRRTTPVGLLPCGTGNVLGRALKLPMRPERAAEAFLKGRIQELDVARVGERLAHLVVGVGFDARTVQEVERRRRGPITKAIYVGATLQALRTHRPVPLRVWLDEDAAPHAAGMVWVLNTPKYADFLRGAPGTRVDDGQWEVYLFPTGRRGELLRAALRGWFAHLPGGAVEMRRACRVRIESEVPVPYQVDGDLGGSTPVAFEVLPERFRLVVP
jgi:diacylglycerol kinase (ATP)